MKCKPILVACLLMFCVSLLTTAVPCLAREEQVSLTGAIPGEFWKSNLTSLHQIMTNRHDEAEYNLTNPMGWTYLQYLLYLRQQRSDDPNTDVNPYDVLRYDVEMTVNPSSGHIDADAKISLKLLTNEVSTIAFTWFYPDMTIDRAYEVDWNGVEQDIPFSYDPVTYLLTLTYPTLLGLDETHEIIFHISGNPSCGPDAFYGMLFCEYTANFFYTSDLYLPYKTYYDPDYATDFFEFDLALNVPIDFTTTSGGVFQGRSDNEKIGSATEYWHRELGNMSGGMAGAPFHVHEANSKNTNITTRILNPYKDSASYDKYAQIGAKSIDYYHQLFAPYQFKKLDIVAAADALGGGYALPELIMIGNNNFQANPDDFYSSHIIAHEIAHQWWGHTIMNGDYYSPWLSEGYADYSAYRFEEDEIWKNTRTGDYMFEWSGQVYRYYVPAENDVPITSPKIYSADLNTYVFLTYYKGSLIPRMLETVLGQDAFRKGMQFYAEQFKNKNSTVLDLQQALETSSGIPLGYFFDEWVHRKGYPVYKTGWVANQLIDGRYEMYITIVQNPVFIMPLEVYVQAGDQLISTKFLMNTPQQTIRLYTEQKPKRVYIDPYSRVLKRVEPLLPGDVNLSSQVDGDDLILMAWAMNTEFSQHWNWREDCDLNYDRKVDATDLKIVLDNFGRIWQNLPQQPSAGNEE